LFASVAMAACGSGGTYSRVLDSAGPSGSGGDATPTDDAGQGGNTSPGGTGGVTVGSGGTIAPGQGGHGGTVSTGSGGSGSGRGGKDGGTGGASTGSGGAAGGAPATGSGGSSSGGNGGHTTSTGTGGNVGTGGTVSPGTGGAGGRATGSGGVGTGGSTTGNGGAGGRGGAGGAGGSRPSGPRIISVDFVGGGPAGAPGIMAMASTETAGVRSVAQWNSATGSAGTLSPLMVADGTSVGASLAWSSPVAGSATGTYWVGYTDMAGDTRMMNGYLDPGSASMPATVTVTGLPSSFTSSGYDVYVYMAGYVPSGTRTYNYTIGSTTIVVSQTGPSGTTFPGYTLAPNNGAGNYVVFKQLSSSSFTLTAKPGSGSGTQTRAPVNGVQIVSPSGS